MGEGYDDTRVRHVGAVEVLAEAPPRCNTPRPAGPRPAAVKHESAGIRQGFRFLEKC